MGFQKRRALSAPNTTKTIMKKIYPSRDRGGFIF